MSHLLPYRKQVTSQSLPDGFIDGVEWGATVFTSDGIVEVTLSGIGGSGIRLRLLRGDVARQRSAVVAGDGVFEIVESCYGTGVSRCRSEVHAGGGFEESWYHHRDL